jgi:hypothetical protein
MTSIDEVYRPPQAPAPRDDRVRIAGAALRWVYAGLGLVGIVTGMLGGVFTASEDAFAGAATFLFFCAAIVGLCWVHQAFKDIPREDRFSPPLNGLSAGSAVRRLFIPFYNLYWGFALHTLLCAAISASLRKRRDDEVEEAASPLLAYCAMGCLIGVRFLVAASEAVSGVLFLASMVLWFVYMSQLDQVRRMVVLAWHAEREGVPPAQAGGTSVLCALCKSTNDGDAVFCTKCGGAVGVVPDVAR